VKLRRWFVHLLRAAPLLAVAFSADASATDSPPPMTLSAGLYRIEAETANSEESRQRGLMYRTQMPANHGMLFVFGPPQAYCMWMKNTLIPLSVAFLDEGGQIINIEEMQPRSEIVHCAARAAKFALEMNGRWFARHGISTGDHIGGLKAAPPAR